MTEESSSENSNPVEGVLDKMSDDMRAEFENNAVAVASQFSIDLDSVRSTYASKPESLSAAFNSMSEAKSDRNSWIGWSVAWLIFVPPIMLYTGWKALEAHDKLNGVKHMINNEVQNKGPSPKS
jgi:hypothetical protein